MADTVSTPLSGVVLNTLNSAAQLSVSGFGGVAFQVQGTFTGTITFEASVQGQDFAAFRVVPANSSTPTSTTTSTGLWAGSCVGYLVVRARMSSYSDGAAIVLIRADVASPGGGGGGGGTGSDVNLIEVGGESITLGEAPMAASLPVVIASDQTPIDVVITGGGGGGTSSDFGDPFPADGTAVGVADPDGNMRPLSAETLDYDSGAGTVAQTVIGIALPGSGGPVAGGTAANPFNVAAASLPLPTGAATLAEQQTQTTALGTLLTSANFAAAFGTAGTADSQVMSVQGIASMTPVQVSQATASNLNATVVGTGTFAAQVTAVGTIADDSTTPGNPVMVGGTAKNPDGTDPGSVSAENDVTRLITDLNRRLYINDAHPRTLNKHLAADTYTDETVASDPGDGFQIVITNIIASKAVAGAGNFFLEEGASVVFGPIALEAVAGRGFCSGPIHKFITASTAVTLTSDEDIAFDIEYYIQAVP